MAANKTNISTISTARPISSFLSDFRGGVALGFCSEGMQLV